MFFIVTAQLLFSQFYQNDKTTIAIRFVKLIETNHDFSGKGMLCLDFDGHIHEKNSWAEEPPVFHFVGVLLSKIMPQAFFIKFYPVFLSSFIVFGILMLGGVYFPKLYEKNTWAFVLLIAYTPIINIHFAKFVPDLLSFALMIWSIYFYEKKMPTWSWLFALFSVTTKALAIIGFFFYFLGKLLSNEENLKLSKRIIKYSFWGLTLIPSLYWFWIIKKNNWDSPFFQTSINFNQHTGGTDFKKALTLHYWARYITFVITRGVSWPVFFITSFEIFQGLRLKNLNKMDKSFLIFLAGSPLYWLLIRAQSSDPWKSFYLILPFLYFAFRFLERQKSRIVIIFSLIVFLTSVTLVKYSIDTTKNFTATDKNLDVMLACDYFEATKRMNDKKH